MKNLERFWANENYFQPTLVAPRSKGRVCGPSLSGIAGSNPAGSWMSVCCECVLSGRGLCDGLIPRPEEEPYRMRTRVCHCV